MLFRIFLGLIVVFCSQIAYASSETFPKKLEGYWEQSVNGEHGNISIVITEKEGDTIKGILTLTGSAYCKDPIPFRGTGSGSTAYIIGDGPIICGYGGTLRGQVSRINDESYAGNFSYTWFGITWAYGTFQLTPKVPSEKTSSAE